MRSDVHRKVVAFKQMTKAQDGRFVRQPGTGTFANSQYSRLDDLHEHGPWRHPFHLLKRLALARCLGRQIHDETELLCGRFLVVMPRG
jgi:hypothetical protein